MYLHLLQKNVDLSNIAYNTGIETIVDLFDYLSETSEI